MEIHAVFHQIRCSALSINHIAEENGGRFVDIMSSILKKTGLRLNPGVEHRDGRRYPFELLDLRRMPLRLPFTWKAFVESFSLYAVWPIGLPAACRCHKNRVTT